MKSYDIESGNNKTFKYFQTLLRTKGIKESQEGLIFGEKAVNDVLKNKPNFVQSLIVNSSIETPPINQGSCIYKLEKKIFEELDVFGTKKPILLVRVPEIKEFTLKEKYRGCNLILPFQDPSNIGAAIRSAVAFNIKNIFLTEGAAHPFHPKATRAASGAVFEPNYYKISNLNQLSLPCLGLDKSGNDIEKIVFPDNFFLLPGVEGLGISEEIKKNSRLISIPIQDSVESLNATVATSIALYLWHRQNS